MICAETPLSINRRKHLVNTVNTQLLDCFESTQSEKSEHLVTDRICAYFLFTSTSKICGV